MRVPYDSRDQLLSNLNDFLLAGTFGRRRSPSKLPTPRIHLQNLDIRARKFTLNLT